MEFCMPRVSTSLISIDLVYPRISLAQRIVLFRIEHNAKFLLNQIDG